MTLKAPSQSSTLSEDLGIYSDTYLPGEPSGSRHKKNRVLTSAGRSSGRRRDRSRKPEVPLLHHPLQKTRRPRRLLSWQVYQVILLQAAAQRCSILLTFRFRRCAGRFMFSTSSKGLAVNDSWLLCQGSPLSLRILTCTGRRCKSRRPRS